MMIDSITANQRFSLFADWFPQRAHKSTKALSRSVQDENKKVKDKIWLQFFLLSLVCVWSILTATETGTHFTYQFFSCHGLQNLNLFHILPAI